MGLGIKIPKNSLRKGREKFKDDDGGGDIQLESGTYYAAVKKMRGAETNKGPQIILDCYPGGDNVDPKDYGKKFSLWYSFDEDRVLYLFRDLTKLGYEVDDLDDKLLDEIAKDIEENQPVVKVGCKNGEYCNYRIKALVEDMDAAELFGGESVSEDEEEAEEEEDEEEEEGDELDDLNRTQLKAFIKKNNLDVKVLKKHTDDDIRNAIREAVEEED